jgi:DNA primase
MRQPERLTIEFLKKERKGRVFIDWLRNNFGATGVCPFSLRPSTGAPVARPIDWDELAGTASDNYSLLDVENWIGDDPWKEAEPIDLTPAADQLRRLIEKESIELPAFDRFGR